MNMNESVKRLLKKASFNQDVEALWIEQNPTTTSATNLLNILYELAALEEKYRVHGVPEYILIDSLSDLRYRVERFKATHGSVGLSDHDIHWLQDFLNFKMFDLGSLRFQIFPFDLTYIERSGDDALPLTAVQKERFQAGSIYLNIHILKGANLSVDAVFDALERARVFFRKYFGHLKIEGFITRTWLIYSKMEIWLPEESNIVQFGKCFEIIHEAPIRYQILERAFGTQDLTKIAAMPKKTYLQKHVLENLDNIGVSFGYIPFKI